MPRGGSRRSVVVAVAFEPREGFAVSKLKLVLVLAFAVALIALAAFGAGWKWRPRGPQAAPQEQVAGWTWARAVE
jgi:hypothetical protein